MCVCVCVCVCMGGGEGGGGTGGAGFIAQWTVPESGCSGLGAITKGHNINSSQPKIRSTHCYVSWVSPENLWIYPAFCFSLFFLFFLASTPNRTWHEHRRVLSLRPLDSGYHQRPFSFSSYGTIFATINSYSLSLICHPDIRGHEAPHHLPSTKHKPEMTVGLDRWCATGLTSMASVTDRA